MQRATAINNLAPSTIYSVQVRAVNKVGYTDWSGAVERELKKK